MKNLSLLVAVLIAAYLYMHPRAEIQEAPPPVVVQATPVPKMYYHSPLDASAMPTNYSTGTGYYSADPATSRFNGHAVGGSYSASRAGGSTAYYPSGGSVSNAVIYRGTGGAALDARSAPPSRAYISSQRPGYSGSPLSGQRATQ